LVSNYYSPPWVAECLVPHIKHLHHIIDPAAGRGGFSKVLSKDQSVSVVNSDIIPYSEGDLSIPALNFFSEKWERKHSKVIPKLEKGDGGVVTAPPVHLVVEFWRRSLRLTSPHGTVALWLEAAADTEYRYKVMFLDSTFYKKVVPIRPVLYGSSQPMAWYIWRWQYGGAPVLAYSAHE
jgi:hypothetical protein